MWKSSYMIGVDQIDQQHKQLVGTLSDLLKCVNSEDGCSGAQCKQTIEFLNDYVVNHFTAEEMLQGEIGFPELEAHRKMHEDFKVQLHEMELALIRSDYCKERTNEVVRFLTRWLIFHIMKEDKKMMNYL